MHIPDDFIFDRQSFQVPLPTVVIKHILPDVETSPNLLNLETKRLTCTVQSPRYKNIMNINLFFNSWKDICMICDTVTGPWKECK